MGQGFAVLLAGIGLWLLLSYAQLRRPVAGRDRLPALAVGAGRAAADGAHASGSRGVRVGDIMDSQPVAIPATTAVGQALDEYFLRYGWAWFPVVDESGRFVGIARRERVQASADGGEGWLTIRRCWSPTASRACASSEDRPITELLASESLGRLGALMAVDGEGVLRGVVTVEQVRRALQSAFA